MPYDLRSALFSDYAAKFRFVKLPAGQKARYSADHTLEFPVGTVIAKTFAYPADLRRPEQGLDLLETRILIHQSTGWIGLPYVWNEDESEATLRLAGTMLKASLTDAAGERVDHQYLVPNANQCKGCHRVEDDTFEPIGPKARYLNQDFAYAAGAENQLAHWTRVGILDGASVARGRAARSGVGRPVDREPRRPRAHLPRDQLRALPLDRRPGAHHRPRPHLGRARAGQAGRLQVPGRRRPRLGRSPLRHRAGRARPVDPDVPHDSRSIPA